MSRHRRVVGIVAVAAFVACALGVPVRATSRQQVSGDEPHYLLTAISLFEDASLDVSDEYTQERFLPFHNRDIRPQGVEWPDGRIVEPHDPLLPALLAVPVGVAGWAGAKLALAAMAGVLAGLLAWTLIRRFDVPARTAGLTVGIFATSVPLAPYGNQVYPESPAALAVTAAVAAITGPLATPGLLVAGASVVALPWLSVKYVPVAAVLAILCLWRLWRDERRRSAGLLAGALGAAGVMYVVAHLAWYGGLTVYAAGHFFDDHGGQLSVLGTAPDIIGRSTRLVGLLVDRHFGIAAWQPAWLVLLPSVGALLRGGRHRWSVLLPLAVGWIGATFLAATMHGWWFPGRHAVVVLPLAVLAIGCWVGRSRWRLVATTALGAAGLVSYARVLRAGWAGSGNWIEGVPTATPPWMHVPVMPDYVRLSMLQWALHAVWVLAAAAALVGGYGRASARTGAGAGARSRPGAGRGARRPSVELTNPSAVIGPAGGDEGRGQGDDDRPLHSRAR